MKRSFADVTWRKPYLFGVAQAGLADLETVDGISTAVARPKAWGRSWLPGTGRNAMEPSGAI